MNLSITRTTANNHLTECARLMSNSEPWKTLKREYDACLKTISEPDKEVYIVLSDKKLIGFALLQMQGIFKGYIQSICIAEENQGKGIGSLLLKFCEDRIFEDSPNVFICVSSFNPRARIGKKIHHCRF